MYNVHCTSCFNNDVMIINLHVVIKIVILYTFIWVLALALTEWQALQNDSPHIKPCCSSGSLCG